MKAALSTYIPTFISCLVTVVLTCIGVLFYSTVSAQEAPKVEKGIIDLRDWKFQHHNAISLSGEWEFYWDELLYPIDFEEKRESKNYRAFPKLWKNDSLGHQRVTPQGFATHRMQIILNSVTPELAFTVPHFYSSYLLFVNGEYLSSNGQVGPSDDSSQPHWRQITRSFKATSDTLEVILQISNFKHAKGGANLELKLGERVKMETMQGHERAFNLIMSSSLFFIGLFFLVLFWFGRHEKQILFFALFCLIYSYRSIGSGSYTLHSLFPDLPWLIAIKMEYISLYLSALFFSYYSFNLYKRETSRLFLLLVSILCLGFSVVTLFFSVRVFSQLMGPFSLVVLSSFIYLFYTYFHAVKMKRDGSVLSLISTMMLFVVVCVVFMESIDVFKGSKMFYFIGYQQFFFIQSIILFYRYNRKMQIAREKAESAARAQSDFLSMISHEIRTPLNGVIGLTNFIMSDNPKEAHKEDLKTLKFSAEHLHVLINDVLDYSKLDAGKIEFEETDVNILELAENIVRGQKHKAKEKDIYIHFIHDEKIPLYVKCDGLRLSQILTNLVGNAIKFTEKGGVTLGLSVVTINEEKAAVKFSIEDSGIGIPLSKQKTIFDSFSQASTSTTREYGGTGLGLSITKRILDLQHVKINLFSVEGQGSRFYFTQSFKISDKKDSPAESIEAAKHDLTGKDILLVEDNPINVMVAKKFLSRWDMNIDVAENGAEAVEQAVKKDYDLILMDLQMPVMDGYTASETLREQGLIVPILALTASVMLDVGDRVFKSGMNDFITKPFDPDDLYNKIRIQIAEYDELRAD